MPRCATPPIPRPTLARFIWERGLTFAEVGQQLGCSYEHVRRICLPFGDRQRRVPQEELMARIIDWTGGECPPASFYPSRLQLPDERDPAGQGGTGAPVLEGAQV